MQKLTLRFVVVGLVYYLFVVIEGMIMRLFEVNPIPFVSETQFFAILTAHPLGGYFWINLLHCMRGLSLPGSLPDEKAPVEH